MAFLFGKKTLSQKLIYVALPRFPHLGRFDLDRNEFFILYNNIIRNPFGLMFIRNQGLINVGIGKGHLNPDIGSANCPARNPQPFFCGPAPAPELPADGQDCQS